jgi:hypothetical protein
MALERVPVVVIGPPEIPQDVAMEVTVPEPPPPEALIVQLIDVVEEHVPLVVIFVPAVIVAEVTVPLPPPPPGTCAKTDLAKKISARITMIFFILVFLRRIR